MNRIQGIIDKYKPWIDILGAEICACITNGDVTPNFDILRELEMILDILENYSVCLEPEALDCYEDRLQDIINDCDNIIPPPVVDPDTCPDDAIVTEDTADCLITEDTGDYIIIE